MSKAFLACMFHRCWCRVLAIVAPTRRRVFKNMLCKTMMFENAGLTISFAVVVVVVCSVLVVAVVVVSSSWLQLSWIELGWVEMPRSEPFPASDASACEAAQFGVNL